jgi:hypothetical protein
LLSRSPSGFPGKRGYFIFQLAEPLDAETLSADLRAHQATRVLPDMSRRIRFWNDRQE